MTIQPYKTLSLLLFCMILITPWLGYAASGNGLFTTQIGLEESRKTNHRVEREQSPRPWGLKKAKPTSKDNFLKKALIWAIVTIISFSVGYLILFVLGGGLVLGIIGATLWGGGSVAFCLAAKNLLLWMIDKGWLDWMANL